MTVLLLAAAWTPAEDGQLPEPVLLGRLPKDSVPESSGLALNTKQAHSYWTLNDSGNTPELIAVDAQGQLVRRLSVPNAKNVDWEGLAADGKGHLVIADIGDNARKRAACALYVLPEPDPGKADEKIAPESVKVYRVAYPKDVGAQDAEALVVRDGTAYIFTKEKERTRVFKYALPDQPPVETAVLEFAAETQDIALITAADISADGTRLALLSYAQVWTAAWPKDGKGLFTANLRKRVKELGQSEGLCWDGDDLVISCEAKPGTGGEFWRIPKAK